MKRAIVLGAGSWGTALSAMLASRGMQVQFWGRDPALMEEIAGTRKNARYLPEQVLPNEVTVTHHLDELESADLVVFVVPSRGMRAMAENVKKLRVLRGGEGLLSCTKGIELESGERMSEILGEVFPGHPLAALSGPNHAEEIARRMPSAAVVASADHALALRLQDVFTLPWFRCYTSDDLCGVEWAGAMKNPYAIAAGIARGLRLGDNAIAALVTRALAEMVRLGVKCGGRMETFYGLSGVGDLVATCYSEHSRNNRVGKMLGEGKGLAEIVAGTRMVAEGVPNTESLWRCARRIEVDTPLLDEVYAVLYQGKSSKDALRELLGRDPRPEAD
ncbi:MAG TPA: NAD(P)H-dependent glycerol-3-phosphate dehydrogenase [Verrucomicrobiaceae bacterium]|jgi:glycerol-3-phosphate dehydrogenase (NAD(P)+)